LGGTIIGMAVIIAGLVFIAGPTFSAKAAILNMDEVIEKMQEDIGSK
jgi:hypothetical protein